MLHMLLAFGIYAAPANALTDRTMMRYVFNFKGTQAVPPDDLRLIRATVQVVDMSRKSLLVEATEEEAAELARQLPGWTMQRELFYQTPPTRHTVQKAPRS